MSPVVTIYIFLKSVANDIQLYNIVNIANSNDGKRSHRNPRIGPSVEEKKADEEKTSTIDSAEKETVKDTTPEPSNTPAAETKPARHRRVRKPAPTEKPKDMTPIDDGDIPF